MFLRSLWKAAVFLRSLWKAAVFALTFARVRFDICAALTFARVRIGYCIVFFIKVTLASFSLLKLHLHRSFQTGIASFGWK